jgi:Membrane carboxypeptidase (penicillin-binding protein)
MKCFSKQLVYSFLLLFLVSSCNKGEGIGGTSSVEGYVYSIRHHEDDSRFPIDTVPASKEDVFIIFGDDDYFGDDIETDESGFYKFDYLRKGNYTVFAYSSFDDGSQKAVYSSVKVSGKVNKADTLFIHTGKANGTGMVRGMVYVRYYNKDRLVKIDGEELFPAIGHRVYIKLEGQDIIADDVRTDNNGVFVFQRLKPGRYEIFTDTEKPGDDYKNVLFPSKPQFIEVKAEPQIIYDLPETFEIVINT